MDWITNQIKKVFSYNTNWLPTIVNDLKIPTVKQPKKEGDLTVNIAPNKCVNCKSFQAKEKDTLVGSCFHYPPIPVYTNKNKDNSVLFVRPTVYGDDLACSKFKRKVVLL